MPTTLRPLVLCALLVACGAPPRPVVVVPPAPVVAAPVDADGDGVLGEADRCPDAPEDCDGFEDADGCPDPDNDHDNILDVCDGCPDEPGGPSPDGCPPVLMERQEVRVVSVVYFGANRVVPLPASVAVLDAVTALMGSHPELLRVEVRGNASLGERDAQRLSQRRADAVLAALTHRGVEAARLEAHGFGANQPIEPNTTPAGRANNQRVEFRILSMDPPPSTTPPPPRPPRRLVPDGCPDHPPPPTPGPCTAAR